MFHLAPPLKKAKPPSVAHRSDSAYERHKKQATERQRRLSMRGREIKPGFPAVAKPRRRKLCEKDFKRFLKTYFPETFYLPFSPDHDRVIKRIEQAILKGGLFAMAMPRGSGKTAFCLAACLWAVLYGHHSFVALIASTQTKAEGLLADVWTQLQTNAALLEDFPEVCYPIRRLQGVAQRRLLYGGEQVRMKFKKDDLVFPNLPGSVSASAVIRAAGLNGAAIRGMRFTRPDGREVRPSVVVIDDPQTDDSAKSGTQVTELELLLNGAVLGMAGPGKAISGIMPCTVIRHDDLADRILDRKKNPQWRGERTKLVYAWPANTALWDEYLELRADDLRNERGPERCNRFYRKHRTEMDKGSKVGWKERKNKDELSAIQHAMNLRFDRGEIAFDAEFQNDPVKPVTLDTYKLSADQIAIRINHVPRSTSPAGTQKVTAFIDVQQDVLYWVAAAWADDFTGAVIDYGTWPDQAMAYFTLSRLRLTLRDLYPGKAVEGAWYAGIRDLTKHLSQREWSRDDGAILRLSKGLVDGNDGNATDTVYQACRENNYAALWMPSHGVGIGSGGRSMAERAIKAGDKRGLNWIEYARTSGRQTAHVSYDTNWWKSFVFSRLATPQGDSGALSLFGDSPEKHKLYADHMTAETFKRTVLKGTSREVDEWTRTPGRDNHWFDGTVGAAVAASTLGVSRPDAKVIVPEKKTWAIPAHLRRN